MLEPALKNQKIELIAQNFKPDEIDELGRLLFKQYNSHDLTNTETHFTLSPRKCASALVEECIAKNQVDRLIELVVSLDDQTIKGRQLRIDGLELFLREFANSGRIYDFKRRKVVTLKKDLEDQVNWGSLNSGRQYPITVMSLDVVDNSLLVKQYGNRIMEKVYFHLRRYLEERIARYDGRIWNFAGDGGLIAFTFKGHQDRAVFCGLEIQRSIPLLQLREDVPVKKPVALRIGLDTGKVKFQMETGAIVSEVINYASHLEKKHAQPGSVAVSGTLHGELSPKLSSLFTCTGEFEGQQAFCTPGRIDNI